VTMKHLNNGEDHDQPIFLMYIVKRILLFICMLWYI